MTPDTPTRAAAFRRAIQARNHRELSTAALLLVGLTAMAFLLPVTGLAQVGLGVSIAAVLGVAGVIVGLGRVRGLEVPEAQLADALRAEANRQAALLRWAPLWYAVPLAGGPALFVTGVNRMVGEGPPVLLILAIFGMGAGVGWLNTHAAERLEADFGTPRPTR